MPKDDSVPISAIPLELKDKARELGKLWAESSGRPRLSREIKAAWDKAIDEWVTDPEMPLAVRKMGSGVRGGVVVHGSSGREIIFADNSPAQWAFTCALRGHQYSLAELKNLLKTNRIPFTFATKAAEKSEVRYRGTLSSCGIDLNAKGWKLCHIDGVGLRDRTPIRELSLSQLQDHFRLLLKPSNHFVVPKLWSGMGEIPEVIQEIRDYEAVH